MKKSLRGASSAFCGTAALRRPSQVDRDPTHGESGDARRGSCGVDDDQAIGRDPARTRQPLCNRIGDGPPARLAAQGGRRLGLVVAGAGVDVPGPELAQHGPDQGLALHRLGLGPLRQLVAARLFQGPASDAAELECLLAELGPHDESRARASRMRCTSMLPDATVEAWA